jgi:RHS repeat-associated protein
VATGAASGNPFQYTGSENDGNGLYFMQARYYNPALGRFISEDPIGFAGGDVSLHGYGFNSPTNLEDPDGTEPVEACVVGASVSVIWEAGSNLLAGRKSTLSGFGRTAVNGCVTGVAMEVTGANWLLGKLAGKAISVIADTASPVVAKILETEATEVAEASVGEAIEGAEQDLPVALQKAVADINPTGSMTNCVNCALALDNTLAGFPTSALPSGVTTVNLQGFTLATKESIEQTLLKAGPGAKGIVFGTSGNIGHVFNAVNSEGTIYFLDGQIGSAANLAYKQLFFILR